MAIQNPTSAAAPFFTSAAPLGFSASYQFTRPNNTTAYTANDVVGSSGAIGAILPFVFKSNVPAAGGEAIIEAVRFEHDVTGLIASEASYSLAFYNLPPLSALADNAAYDITSSVTASDRAMYQGILTLGTPVDIGSTLYVEITGQTKRVTLLSNTLYAYLTTAGAYTPNALDTYSLTVYGRMI